jgi:hypothetical protein
MPLHQVPKIEIFMTLFKLLKVVIRFYLRRYSQAARKKGKKSLSIHSILIPSVFMLKPLYNILFQLRKRSN